MTVLFLIVVGGTCLFCHPEFISGSYQLEAVCPTRKMLKQVQHDSFVFNCREGDYSGTLRQENISKFSEGLQYLQQASFAHKIRYTSIL